jgi:ferredoxin-NADP reductase
MITTEYKTRLRHKEECGNGAMAFYLDRPPGFEFEAGQYVDITLINPPETDPDGSIRSFSLASTPAEEHLLVVTRVRDTAFKRTLQQLPTSTEVELDGPFGSFALHANRSKPAIFLAGGIGIAPFSSMIRHAVRTSPQTQLYLFYSNHCPEWRGLPAVSAGARDEGVEFSIHSDDDGDRQVLSVVDWRNRAYHAGYAV